MKRKLYLIILMSIILAFAAMPIICFGQQTTKMQVNKGNGDNDGISQNNNFLVANNVGDIAKKASRANGAIFDINAKAQESATVQRSTKLQNFTTAKESATTTNGEVFSEYLSDYSSGKELKSVNADERHEIASMVKIMTANLVFEAIDNGKISLETKITISSTSAGMGGSQLFLDANQSYSVNDLLKGIIVVSANDASVAMAENLAGSHDAFVAQMNVRAKEYGMNNTLFCNATGLPSTSEQFSTARDVNIMTRRLMSHDLYFEYSKITLEDFVHPSGRKTQLVNTNKLMRYYSGCIGGKTGFTAKAGFCLSACAERNNLKVVATAIGAKDGKSRFAKVSSLFDYAFANYKSIVVYNKGDIIENTVAVKGGKLDVMQLMAGQDIRVLCKNDEQKPQVTYQLPESIKAPVQAGDKVGTATITYGDKTIEIDLLAKETVKKLTFWDIIKDLINKW